MFKLVQSDNGHLFYGVDKDGFICRVSLYKFNIQSWILAKAEMEKK